MGLVFEPCENTRMPDKAKTVPMTDKRMTSMGKENNSRRNQAEGQPKKRPGISLSGFMAPPPSTGIGTKRKPTMMMIVSNGKTLTDRNFVFSKISIGLISNSGSNSRDAIRQHRDKLQTTERDWKMGTTASCWRAVNIGGQTGSIQIPRFSVVTHHLIITLLSPPPNAYYIVPLTF